jgi:hypothetical protein
MFGAGTRNRTTDLLITNQLLYQLSYAGEWPRIILSNAARCKDNYQEDHSELGQVA